jgi:hypothetical protein
MVAPRRGYRHEYSYPTRLERSYLDRDIPRRHMAGRRPAPRHVAPAPGGFPSSGRTPSNSSGRLPRSGRRADLDRRRAQSSAEITPLSRPWLKPVAVPRSCRYRAEPPLRRRATPAPTIGRRNVNPCCRQTCLVLRREAPHSVQCKPEHDHSRRPSSEGRRPARRIPAMVLTLGEL